MTRKCLFTALMMLAPTMSGAASAATVHPKAKPSAATYCKAAKSWLAFENATLAAGPYDTLWYETTGELMTKLKAAAPKPIWGRFSGSGWRLSGR